MEHPCDLAEWIGGLYLDEKSSDVILVVEDEYLPAHKLILAASCEYFRALLRGNMKESLESKVLLKDITLRGFKLLLNYIYTGQLKLREWDDETALEVLQVAHLYGFEKVQCTLVRHLEGKFSVENIVMILEKALSLRLKDFCEACRVFMDGVSSAILASETFYHLSAADFYDILSRDTFCSDEIDIFKAVERWCEDHSTDNDRATVLEAIRLPLIATAELVTTVKDSGLICSDRLIEAIRRRKCYATDLNFRKDRVPEKNFATEEQGARTSKERPCGAIRKPIAYSSYGSMGPPPGFVLVNDSTGYTIKLSKLSLINHIALKLMLGNYNTYSYFIEASVDLAAWFRLIDHSNYACSSVQKLYFDPRVVRYIRIFSTQARPFYLENFEVLYTEKSFKLACGFVAPKENVASITRGAAVIESRGESNALIREIPVDSRDRSKWASHDIGNVSVLIRLSQPYTVHSIRMLLMDHYLYYIETSLDKSNWTRVADRTRDLCSSWQNIHFEPLPVLFLKFVGIGPIGQSVFQRAHFQCPAPEGGPPNATAANSNAENLA